MPIGTRKEYTGAAPATKLASSITSGAMSITVATGTGTGYPTGATGQFVVCIDEGTATEEKILMQSRSGDVFTVAASGRGFDGTTASAHSVVDGQFTHVFDAESAMDFMDHLYDTTRDDHPQYTTAAELEIALAAYLLKTGGVLTGNLEIENAAPQLLIDRTGVVNTWSLSLNSTGELQFIYDAADDGTFDASVLRLSPTQVRAGMDGTAALPALSFDADPDTGIYRRGADEMAFTRGGAQYLALISNSVIPGNIDNGVSLGNASFRWSQLFAGTATINTSDESTKDGIGDTPLGLDFILALRPIRWRFLDGRRPHDGLGAEQVREALDAVGVKDAALYVDPAVGAAALEKSGPPKKHKDESKDEHDERVAAWRERVAAEYGAPKGLRYSEFIGPLIRAVQEHQEQIAALTARIEALEANG